MKIEWIRRNGDFVYTTDITEAVSTVNWSGSVSQAARSAEITVVNAPDDKNIQALGLKIGAGDIIKLYENGENIFYGYVETPEKTSQIGTVTYSCVDMLNHLLKSDYTNNFANTTAEEITKKVCAELAIETGEIAESKAPIKKLIVDGVSVYDVIMQAYTKAAHQTGDLYICRMTGSKLTVAIKGTVVDGFVLAEEYNITNDTYQETIADMVNVVKIYDDTGKQIGEVRNEEWIEKYGIFQKVYKKEKGINETTAATNMLAGIKKTVNLDGVDANLAYIAGNAVEVQDKATGLDGIFWIDADTHTWENNIHTVNLDLNFNNIMDSKESSETEE